MIFRGSREGSARPVSAPRSVPKAVAVLRSLLSTVGLVLLVVVAEWLFLLIYSNVLSSLGRTPIHPLAIGTISWFVELGAATLVAAVFSAGVHRGRFSPFPLRFGGRVAALSTGGAVAMLAASIAVIAVTGVSGVASWEVTPPAAWFVPIQLLVRDLVLASGEEILWRGYAVQALLPIGATRAVSLTALLFANAHNPPTFLAFIDLLTSGILYALLLLRSGSLIPSIAVHMAHNLCASLLLINFPGESLMWHTGQITTEIRWAFLIADVVLIVALLWSAQRSSKGQRVIGRMQSARRAKEEATLDGVFQ